MLKAGEMVGLGGNTGRSYGSHLHFEMRYLGQALDTEDFIDYTAGTLKCDTFILRKADVENKYDLRALRGRHKRDLGLAKRHYHKNGKYYASAGKAKKGKKKYARKKSYGKVKKKIVYTKATKRKPASKVSKSTKGKQIAKKAKSTKL
jgi:hypothetical protein